MSNYHKKIRNGIKTIENALDILNQSNENWISNEIWNIRHGIRMIENPFQTLPVERYVHITVSFCDPEGSSDNADDLDIDFNREISAGLLYTMLAKIVKSYNEDYKLQVSLSDIEEWLNKQKPLYQTTCPDEPFVHETGLTVADYKTDYGSINFFIEFGINYFEREF